jgi:hypothetical protein
VNLDAQSGNELQAQVSTQPASARLPDEIVRKQQVLRRHLQAPSSPAFNDPVRAAELAGFLLRVRSSGPPGGGGRHWPFRNTLSVRDAVDAAVSRKAETIEVLRRRIAEGMDATKMVTVWDREGARHTAQVPDQAARHNWAQLSALLENLFPAKNDSSSDMLPHDAAQAVELEMVRSVKDEVSRMSPPDRYLVSSALRRLQQIKDILREEAITARLGKPIEEFEQEVEREVDVEMKEVISRVSQQPPAHEGKSDA